MMKKLFILLVMGLVYFAPAIVIASVYGSPEVGVLWLAFGWMPASVAGDILS